MFQHIGLIAKPDDISVVPDLKAVVELLLARGCQLSYGPNTASLLEISDQGQAHEELGKTVDLLIVLGGDGTLLNTARSTADADTPILGINRGRLGFLVDISPADIEQHLNDVLDGHFQDEHRFLIHADLTRNGETRSAGLAFNDVVIHKTDVARMIEIRTQVDGQFVNQHRADGILVSSPTGSTAYALSCGGPLLHPSLEALALVPICPHTLSDRPIVVGSSAIIDMEISDPNERHAQLTLDGQLMINLQGGDIITVSRQPGHVRLIHPAGYDYFNILRAKLNWG